MEDQLSVQYRRRFEVAHAGRVAVWRVLVDSWFSRYVNGVHSVLDLGCGWGEFVNQVDVPTRYALDLNPEAAQAPRPRRRNHLSTRV